MAAKGARNTGFRHGMCTGYTEYRYGAKKKVVTLPRVFEGEKRKHVINDVMDILHDWRATPFEHEGSMRHGLRSGLCLGGHSWHIADSEAQSLLTAAFQSIGAARPTWDQGQRDYTISPENCAWCGVALPDELIEGARKGRFCDSVCAKSALEHRAFEQTYAQSAVGKAAYMTVKREKAPSQVCPACNTSFKPFNLNTINQVYCSIRCRADASRALPKRACVGCKTEFWPRRNDHRYCTQACFYEQRPRIEKICCGCGCLFDAKSIMATACSDSCSRRHRREVRVLETMRAQHRRKAQSNVIPFVPVHMLTATVIDGWFARAA